MSTEKNKIIVERAFAELWYGESKQESLEELIAPDHVFHFQDPINPDPGIGHEGYRRVLNGFAAAFPDYRAKMETIVIAEGDFLLNRWLFEGTHEGPLGEIAPTGKKVSVPGVDVTRISNGKIAETYVYGDNLGMMMQLGVVSLPT